MISDHCLLFLKKYIHPTLHYVTIMFHTKKKENSTICIPIITFNNPLKVCFSNKKYPITIQTRLTLIEKLVLIDF